MRLPSAAPASHLDRETIVGGALLFAMLALFIGAVYAVVVIGIGLALGADIPNTGLSILAMVIVSVAFRRVREAAQRLVNRLLYGERATPYEVLSRFSEQVGGRYATEEVLTRMARIVADGVGAAEVAVWLRVEDHLLPAAAWPPAIGAVRTRVPLPDDGPPVIPGAARTLAVRDRRELLGALAVTKTGDPLTPAEDKLLDDVATQAGLVLRNVRLTAELAARLEEISAQAAQLRASRQRIVAAQDAERRRLERDIHDGAQQHLVALAVKVRMARSLIERDPRRAKAALADLRVLNEEALGTLRDLARGIYPPVLAQRGLAAALRAQAKKSGMTIEVEAGRLRRYAPEVEAAAYFSCLEALQNAAKHARATGARVLLEERDGGLVFRVADDGVGFDAEAAAGGSGLQNMRDRLAAFGGSLEIEASPGRGTTVTGRIPVRAGTRS